jgi:hypothetical protein
MQFERFCSWKFLISHSIRLNADIFIRPIRTFVIFNLFIPAVFTEQYIEGMGQSHCPIASIYPTFVLGLFRPKNCGLCCESYWFLIIAFISKFVAWNSEDVKPLVIRHSIVCATHIIHTLMLFGNKRYFYRESFNTHNIVHIKNK